MLHNCQSAAKVTFYLDELRGQGAFANDLRLYQLSHRIECNPSPNLPVDAQESFRHNPI